MCGIYGSIHSSKTNIISGLCIANESRGKESAGVAFIKKGVPYLIKKAVAPALFVEQYMPDLDGAQAVIGHTRLATQGAVNDRNAHPFVSPCGRYLYVHNGVISNSEEITKEAEVDSEAIGYLLSDMEGDIKKVCKEIRGSAAIAVIDTQTGKLTLVSHYNPINYITIGKTTYFSSEAAHLFMVLRAAGHRISTLDIQTLPCDCARIFSPDGSDPVCINNVEFKPYVYVASHSDNEWDFSKKKERSGFAVSPGDSKDDYADWEEWMERHSGSNSGKNEDAGEDERFSSQGGERSPVEIEVYQDDEGYKFSNWKEREFVYQLGKSAGCLVCCHPIAHGYYDEQFRVVTCVRCAKSFDYKEVGEYYDLRPDAEVLEIDEDVDEEKTIYLKAGGAS